MKTIIFLLSISFLLFGCEPQKKPDIKKLDEAAPHIAVFAEGQKPVIQKVAILPFSNSTKEKVAGEVVRKSVYGHVSWLPYEDTELRYIDMVFQDQGIARNEKETDRDFAVRVGKLLGVDGVIVGNVHHYDRVFVGIYAQIAVGGKLSFVSVKDGTLLWEVDYTERSHEGGIPLDPIGAIATMIRCGMSLSDVNLYHTVNDYAKNATKSVPDFYSMKLAMAGKKGEPPAIQVQEAKIDQQIEAKKKILEKSALEIETEVNLLVLAGDALVREGKNDLAIQTFQEAVEMKPDYTEIHFQLSLLYAERKELKKALYEIDKCIELQPDFSEFYYSRGLLSMEMREKLQEEAASDFNKFRELSPEKEMKVRYLLKRLNAQ